MTAPAPVLETPRLTLRRLEAADAGAVFAYRSNSEVQRYQFWAPAGEREILEFILNKNAAFPEADGRWFQFGILRRDGGALVGDCGLRLTEGGDRQAEFGVTLAPAAQGSGLATEAVRALLAYAFDSRALHRVFASVDPGNASSIRLLERLGLRREAHHVESLWFRGRWADDLVYALLEREWRAGAGESASR